MADSLKQPEPGLSGQLTLAEAQARAWEHRREHPDGVPQTIREALTRLSQTARECLDTFEAEQIVQAQMRLEETLADILVSMKMLGMNAERGLERVIQRDQAQAEASGAKIFHFYADRVEIRSGGELRGEWPIYSEQEYLSALQLARELNCEVRHSDARQLELFVEANR